MATKTRGGLLLPVVIVGAVAVIGVPLLKDKVPGLFGAATGGTELVGTGEGRFMVAASASSQVDGDSFLVVIIHPDQIAADPFRGIDTAKDQACG